MTAPISILVVEDEQIVAMDLEATLRTLGYQVRVRHTGAAAIMQARHEPPNLVLMDIRLQGGMDGVAAAEQIRAEIDLPFVFLTAYADEATRQRVRTITPYGYLVKPFDERTLQTTIEMALTRHAHDQQLKISEQWFRTTLESIGDGVVTTDQAAQVTYINSVAAELLATQPSQAIGRPVAAVVPLYDPQTAQPLPDHPVQLALTTGMTLNQDLLLRTSDGREIWIDESAAPIQIDCGTTLGAVMVIRDASDRRQAEHERLEIQRRQEEIRHLERLHVLSGGIAHDLNNLLTGIFGYTQLAQLHSGNAELIDDALAQIETICYRATELTQHLLAYAGRTQLALQPVDMNTVVRDVLAELRSSLLQNLPVQLDLQTALPAINSDPGHIHQIVLNLIVNAAEAVADTAGSISIRTALRLFPAMPASTTLTRVALAAGSYVTLEVNDTGMGMDSATCTRIFEPFFSTKFAGRGLGLAAVMGNIRTHGGTILLDSAIGKGSRFTVILPACAEAAQAPSARPTSSWSGQGTVLVIDDQAVVRQVIQRLLVQIGFNVLMAETGGAALALFEQSNLPIIGILLDLTLPDLPTSEIIQRARAIQPDVPVILMSGYSQEDVASVLANTSQIRFLAKPFTMETLRTSLRQMINA
ncbi:MAG: response regulator [Herpetosiphonaceae bacterium]|nr:response regulator [Herpetosiphonaceae bacterium]